jgi:tetratricopeptide (TPR) repeat protein
MIVKNEAKNLPELLGPLRGKFDQVVVVDTGSDDGTPEIAREYGAEVYSFQWINDFSAARNESIRHARCDWLFWLDGDDRMHPDEVERIRRVVAKYPRRDVAFFCHLRSLGSSWEGDQNLLQLRLFPNLPGVAFDGKVHERITGNLVQMGLRLDSCPVEIVHTGYMDPDRLPQKLDRNLELLNAMLEHNPNDISARYQLVMQYLTMGLQDKAVEECITLARCIDQATELRSDTFHRYIILRGTVHLHRHDISEAKEWFQRLVDVHPTLGVGHFLLARVYFEERNWPLVLEHVLKAEYHGIALDALPIPMAQVHFDMATMRALCYQQSKQWVLAAQEFRKAINVNGEFVSHYIEMGHSYLMGKDFARAVLAFEAGIHLYDQVESRFPAPEPRRTPPGRMATLLEMTAEERAHALGRMVEGVATGHMAQNRMASAREALEEGVRRCPNSVELAIRYVEWMLRGKRREGAARWTARALELDASAGVLEALVNLHLLFGMGHAALPLLRRLWQSAPEKWDAALIAVLVACQVGDGSAAKGQLADMRAHLMETGLAQAQSWPSEWSGDHPALRYFSDVSFWSQPSGDAAGPEERDRRAAYATKLAAICNAIRAQLTHGAPPRPDPSMWKVGRATSNAAEENSSP